MTTLTFTIEMDDEAMSEFDALAATKGHCRNGMMQHLVEEFLAFEPDVQGYDTWFRKEVEEALVDIDAPDAVFYSNDDVMEEMKAVVRRRVTQVQKRAS